MEDDIPIAPSLYSLSNKMDNSLLAVRDINHKYIVVEWRGEKCSWDTFKSGNYVLVDYGDKYAEHPVSYYQTGDVFQMEYKNGNEKITKSLEKH